jgi:hypothetical protein
MSSRLSAQSAFLLATLLGCIFFAAPAFAAGAPVSASQVALYQGGDREKILIEGAKKEGQLTLYDSHT